MATNFGTKTKRGVTGFISKIMNDTVSLVNGVFEISQSKQNTTGKYEKMLPWQPNFGENERKYTKTAITSFMEEISIRF